MIRFDTFIFDDDTKSIIVFSYTVVLQRVPRVLLLFADFRWEGFLL